MFGFFKSKSIKKDETIGKINFNTLTPERLLMMEKYTPAQLTETYYSNNFPFKIKSNVIPPRENYDKINFYEQTFLSSLLVKIINAQLNPKEIVLTRLGDNTFNVNYGNVCYVGKINLAPIITSDRYAVLKHGNKRALRILNSQQEAEVYLQEHNGDAIEIIEGSSNPFKMQYIISDTEFENVETKDIQVFMNLIDKWVIYIKKCLDRQSTY